MFNMAEAKVTITAQTQGEQEVSHLQKAVNDLNRQVKEFAAQAGVSGNAAARMAREAQGVARVNGLAAYQTQNLAFQFQDLGVQLVQAAQSSAPLKLAFTALLQQGSQISGIMSQAGIGVGGLAKEIGAMVLRFAPAIAAVGAMALGVGLLTSEINEDAKVHVTWQDTLLGVYDAVKSYLTGTLTEAFKFFGTTTTDVWKDVLSATKTAVNVMIGLSSLPARAFITAFRVLPAALGEVMIDTANAVIGGINGLIRAGVSGINSFVGTMQPLLSRFGIDLGTFSAPQIETITQRWAGAAAQAAKGLTGVAKDTFTRDFLGEAAAAISPFAEARARQRVAKDAKDAGKGAGKAFTDGASEELKRLATITNEIMKSFKPFGDRASEAFAGRDKAGAAFIMDDLAKKLRERTQPALDEAKRRFDSFGGGTKAAFQSYGEQIGTAGQQAFSMWTKALHSTEDALVNFVTTGKLNFKDLANSIIGDLARIAIQKAIIAPLTKLLGFSQGGTFLNGNVIPHATGGIVGSPTLFPMSGGRTGMMGEAGPEAIVPLRRMPSGRLGVETGGGGGSANVTVNVDASGSSVQGSSAGASQLGRVIGSAVQAELIRQKRPGGLLAQM